MKTPPFLLFAALLFWGWQSNLLWAGALVGVALEASRLIKLRWDLEDVDFNRIWSLCIVVILVLFGYIFTTNDQGGGLSGMTHGPAAAHNVTVSSSLAANSVLRWLPLVCFPLLAAQVYNVRPTVPLTAVSMVLRIRRRRGEQSLAGRYVDLSYAYFILCIFSAGVHASKGTIIGTYAYIGGQGILILWALWMLRSKRFGLKAWIGALAVVMALGFCGLIGVNGLLRKAQELDAKFFARFFRSRTDVSQSITSLGQIGELGLSPRIVIRLEPERPGVAPDYLREASYRAYQVRGQTWLAGGSSNNFSILQPQPDNTTWILLSNKVGNATVNISCYLNGRSEEGDIEGVLPVPSGCCRLLNLPNGTSIVELQTNKTGVVLATGNGLQVFDARYGPGATIDSPPDASTNRYDLKVPDEEANALEQVIAELNLTGTNSEADKRLAVEELFMRKFTYSTWQGPEKKGTATVTPLTRFLLTSRSGHCEYFATATVLLLRKLGIPARYAVGYYVHETSGTGYVVRERDAHAWCLAWNSQTQMWEDFDTTPPSWVGIEGKRASLFDAFSDLRSWLGFQFERFRWRQANLRQYILWSLSPVIVVLVYYIIFQRRAKARSKSGKMRAEAPIVWPGHDSVFYQLENVLAARGLPRQPQEALSDWLERALAEPALASLRVPLRELLQLHYRYRFDPRGLNDVEKKSFVQNAETVLSKLAQVEASL
jgi:hypothetical protein